ncbi:hypothetical protein PU00_02590 [Hafnia alvei]|uniref:acyltransferase family protein n=1 Tax=Hafnia alvei TaxID=569 RepID=UPI0005824ABC|nr:acyltransferase family protein [Hafnia alvei]KID06221.1 hypothetical protein PU00_02590 [Hafnia alvei]
MNITPTKKQSPNSLGHEQSLSVSYMKAIGIIVVVIGHYTSGFFNIMLPYLYHMPLFFFIGGITLKKEPISIGAVKKISIKIIPYMITTYLITGLICVLLNEITGMYYGNPFTQNPLSMNFNNNPLFLVCWFLLAYYFSSLITRILITVTIHIEKQNLILILVSILIGFLAINQCAEIYNKEKLQILNLITQSVYGSTFMLLGFSLKKLALSIYNPLISVLLIVFIATLISYGLIKQSAMAWSTYPSGFIMSTVGSLLCIFVVLNISNILSSNDFSLLKQIGDNSKTIMSWHLSVFAIINVIFYYIGSGNIKGMKLDNTYAQYSFSLYTICGVMIPFICLKIKNRLSL